MVQAGKFLCTATGQWQRQEDEFCPELADLEYAKKVGDAKSHEMRMGTMHFMSVEVAAQKFLFQPRFVNITDFMQDVRNTSGIRKTTIVPFSHNHLHDLESLWWVAVWMVFYNRFSKAQRSDDEPPFTLTEAERQLKLSQISFQETYSGLPRNKAVLCGYLDGLRRILLKHYAVIESTLPHSIDSNASNKNDIYEAFRKLRRDMKRPRAESTNDTGTFIPRKK